MLGNVNPRALRITSQPVVYSGRDNVTRLTLEVLSGRRYAPLDLSAVSRWLLVFPERDPQVLIDSTTETVFSAAGNVLTVDLSGYALDASIQPCWLIAYDAEHPMGQVLVDNVDCVVSFDFRAVSGAGLVPLPLVEYVTAAPADGKKYLQQNGGWVEATALVSGVSSVNGQTGDVVLDAASVGAEPAGTASSAVGAHVAAPDPHPQYALDTDLANHVSSSTPHATLGGVNSLTFDTTAGVVVGEAQMAWNPTDKTVDLGLPGGSVLQIGQELLVRVMNNTGSALASGDMVYITGASGNRLTVAKATSSVGARTMAMVTQAIANNQEGMATVTGLVRDFNTSAFAEGAELWLHPTTPGAVTATRPSAPIRQILVGYCVRSHAVNGSLFVNVRATGSLAVATSDVVITTPAAGQALVYDGTKWVNGALLIAGVTGLQTALDRATFAPVVAEPSASRVSALGDAGSYLNFTNTGAKTYTVQPQASVAWVADSEINGCNAAASDLTLTPGSGVTLNAPYGGTLVIPPFGAFTLKRVAENVWNVHGQTVAA